MAIVECKECGKEISSEAKACPGCGAPASKEKSGLGFKLFGAGLVLFAFVMIFVGVARRDYIPSKEEAAKNYVRESLKDPSSASFGPVIIKKAKSGDSEKEFVACGTVNAKNAYGAFVGQTRFFANGLDFGHDVSIAAASIDGGSESDKQVFEIRWKKECEDQ